MSLEEYREERAAAKREAVLESARCMFANQGFAAASTARIAVEAGVSTATLYRYFPTKQDLFAAAVASAVAALGSGLGDLPPEPRLRLRELARRYALLLSQPEVRGMVRMAVAEANASPAIAAAFDAAGKSGVGALFAEAVTGLVESGGARVTLAISHSAGQLQGMIEHNSLMVGLVRGNAARSAIDPTLVADEAVATWLARFGAGDARAGG